MKKFLSILFAAVLLMTACFALAEEDAPKLTAVRLNDLDIVFGLPSDMEPMENNATFTQDGEAFFGFISQDGQLTVRFYGSKLSDLSEAEDWASENIGDQITKYDVKVNDYSITLDGAQLGAAIDTSAFLDEAYAYGREGSIEERKEAIDKAASGGYDIDYELT